MQTGLDQFIVPDQPVVVGLSGGRDSVALLRLLCEHAVPSFACHVHHGIRLSEADEDAEFCRNLCETLGVPYAQYNADVPSLARQQGESVETAARTVRRRLLMQHARKMKCRAIALAHHAEDQAETVLFNLARGAAGLRGMKERRAEEDVIWLRPLLHCRRTEITTWLQSIGQDWREDATNADPEAATRNRLRLQALPALEQAMGRDVVPLIVRAARLQEEVSQALQEALSQLPLLDPQGRLYLPLLQGRSPAFCKAVVHDYLQRVGVPNITEKHVEMVCRLLQEGAEQHSCNLPGNRIAHRAHKRLRVD